MFSTSSAIGRRSDAAAAVEYVAEILFAGKAGAVGDDLQRQMGVPQQPLGLLDLYAEHLCLRRATKIAMKASFQFVQGQMRYRREGADPNAFASMFLNEMQYAIEDRIIKSVDVC